MALLENENRAAKAAESMPEYGGNILGAVLGLGKLIAGVATVNPALAISGGADIVGQGISAAEKGTMGQDSGLGSGISTAINTGSSIVGGLSGLAQGGAQAVGDFNSVGTQSLGVPSGQVGANEGFRNVPLGDAPFSYKYNPGVRGGPTSSQSM